MAKDGMVVLVRHGVAEPRGRAREGSRALTPAGRSAMLAQAKTMTELAHPVGIATSPLVRCVQTAEILASAFGVRRVDVRRELRPHWRAQARIVELAIELGPGWVLVGHNPSLQRATADLLGRKALPFKLRKGAAVALARHQRGFRFVWLCDPKRPLVGELPAEAE